MLARAQFALTVMFHFIFPAITIGLGLLIAVLETLRWRTGREVYDRAATFWTKLFALTFAVGVATGVVMEFQFGTNWAAYSRFVGDIFGSPLAAEAILAFFLESAFLGLLLFGRDRVSSRLRWFAAMMVALGSTLSGFWIVVAEFLDADAGRLHDRRRQGPPDGLLGRRLQPLDAAALHPHHRLVLVGGRVHHGGRRRVVPAEASAPRRGPDEHDDRRHGRARHRRPDVPRRAT